MEKIDSIVGRVVDALKHSPDGGGKIPATGILLQQDRSVDDIDSLWCKIVDDNMKAHSYVEGVKQNTLFVRVDSSCCLSALKMKSREILAQLKASGCKNVKHITFRM